jgi:hypothetical protein
MVAVVVALLQQYNQNIYLTELQEETAADS